MKNEHEIKYCIQLESFILILSETIVNKTKLYFPIFVHEQKDTKQDLWYSITIGEEAGTSKIRTSKGQNIKSFFRMIRMLKVKMITTSTV
jgi:hypothetical protein